MRNASSLISSMSSAKAKLFYIHFSLSFARAASQGAAHFITGGYFMEVPYLSSGYADIHAIDKMTAATPFVFLIGIRQGAGKTYGLITKFVEDGNKTIFVRRTKDERRKFGNEQLSPLQRVPAASMIVGENEPEVTNLYWRSDDGSVDRSKRFGWVFDLGVASKRGFSVTGFDTVFFDECIPEKLAGGKKDMDNGKTFYNFLITLLANDYPDIKDHPKIWMVGNSDAMVNGIFQTFGITQTVEKMVNKGQTVYISAERCLSIFLIQAPQNAARRAKMPIMRVAAESDTKDMALNNKFGFDYSGIKPQDIRQYQALASFSGDYESYTIWRHKNPYRPRIYVTRGAYPAKHNVFNSKENFTALCRESAFRSRLELWYLVLHSQSGVNAFYDSVTAKQWFNKMAR